VCQRTCDMVVSGACSLCQQRTTMDCKVCEHMRSLHTQHVTCYAAHARRTVVVHRAAGKVVDSRPLESILLVRIQVQKLYGSGSIVALGAYSLLKSTAALGAYSIVALGAYSPSLTSLLTVY
jgi:hypothetical protein